MTPQYSRGDPRRQHALPRCRRRPLRREVGDRLRRHRPRAGRRQGAQGARRAAGPLRAVAGDRLGDGVFHAQHDGAGLIAKATCTDISPGCSPPGCQRQAIGAEGEDRERRRRAAAVQGRQLRPRAGPRRAAPIPDLATRLRRVRARAGTRWHAAVRRRALARGDRLARVPKRFAGTVAPLWRAALRARPAGWADNGSGAHPMRRWRASSTCTRSSLANCASCPWRRPGAGARERRGAAGQLVWLDQPHPGGDRRADRRAVGVAPVRLPRLPRAAGARPPAAGAAAARAIFYNLMLSARKGG